MSEVNAHDRVASEVFVTDADYKILERLLDAPNANHLGARLLSEELDRATRVSDDPSGLFVKLGSYIEFRDTQGDEVKCVQLCLPEHADISAGRISVLAPVGASLLGLMVGGRFQWTGVDRRKRELQILRISDPQLVA